jgi:hypothetical protein
LSQPVWKHRFPRLIRQFKPSADAEAAGNPQAIAKRDMSARQRMDDCFMARTIAVAQLIVDSYRECTAA